MNAIENSDRFLSARFPVDVLSNPLTALVYEESFDVGKIFAAIAEHARGAEIRVGGAMEKPAAAPAPGRRCDMHLQDLATGQTIKISEERGALARGCRLDHDGLARICALVLFSLPDCDLILLNKFGKSEAEGGGFRCIISDSLALDIPIIIGVPRRNLAAWRAFAGDFGTEVEARALFAAFEAA
jgi:hypothetical protein